MTALEQSLATMLIGENDEQLPLVDRNVGVKSDTRL
ncbi:hypothetical protein SUNI508_00187 [Seiridium unicorne]|uniref:RNA polymerase beta subunit n=1 Tax=Seiridium unicorne TaxID=138068 RepID=A0ABR2VJN5_9PEZI